MILGSDGASGADEPARPPLLEIRDVSVRFGPIHALKDLSLQLDRGCTVLLGPNGAGKSTLMTVLAGVRRPDEGSIRLDGREVRTRADLRVLSDRLGFLPQEARLWSKLTVNETMSYGAWLKRVPESRARLGISQALKAVGLEGRRDARVKTLSGGMRRRLAIAQALVSEPEVLLLDEPTTGLDVGQRAGFRDLIGKISTRTAVLVSTHVVGDVASVADRIVVIDGGQLRFHGSLKELCPGTASATGAELESAYLMLIDA